MRPGGRRLHAGHALNPIDVGHMAGLQTCSSAGMSCIGYLGCPRVVLGGAGTGTSTLELHSVPHTHGKCIQFTFALRLIAPL